MTQTVVAAQLVLMLQVVVLVLHVVLLLLLAVVLLCRPELMVLQQQQGQWPMCGLNQGLCTALAQLLLLLRGCDRAL